MDSLRGTLPKIRVLSGSATAIDPCVFRGWTGHPENVEFKATVVRDRDALRAFIRYLTDTLGAVDTSSPHPQIALLSEANTAYGQSASELGSRRTSNPQPRPSPTPAAGFSCPPEKESDWTPPVILNLTFPLHVSQLRSEVEKANAERTGKSDDRMVITNDEVPLPKGERAQREVEVVPPFSPLDAAYSDLVLSKLLTEIQHEPIRYVCLVATDVLDRIFLVREIRQHCPNVVIYIINTDLLYLHSEANLEFIGSLLISPYPLFNQNQAWTFPFRGDRNRYQFPNSAAEGCYNATLALLYLTALDRPDLNFSLLEKPERALGMIDYGNPLCDQPASNPRQPAVWLSVVGRGEVWPVKVVDPDLSRPNACDPEPRSYALSVGRATSNNPPARNLYLANSSKQSVLVWILLAIDFICLRIVITILLGMNRSRLGMTVSETWLARMFGGRSLRVDRFGRHLQLYACCITLLTISVFLSMLIPLPQLVFLFQKSKLSWNVPLSITWLAYPLGLLTAIVIIWLVASVGAWLARATLHRGVVWAVITLGVVTVLGGLACIAMARVVIKGWQSPSEAIFFFLRAIDLGNGVSPVVPFLLVKIAAVLSVVCVIRRLNLAEQMHSLVVPSTRKREFPAFLNLGTKYREGHPQEEAHTRVDSFSGVRPLENRIKRLVICPIFKLSGWLRLLVVILLSYLIIFASGYIPTIDGFWFDLYFKTVFLVVPLLLAWAFLRFVLLWNAINQLLRRLSWNPILSFNSFSDSMAKRLQALPRVNLMSPTPRYTALALSVDQAQRLALEYPQTPDSGAWEASIMKRLSVRASRSLDEALKLEGERRPQDAIVPKRRAQATISAMARLVSRRMDHKLHDADDVTTDHWAEHAAFFLITHVTNFLQHTVAQMQNLTGFVTAGVLLVLLAVSSYPFQPRMPLLWLAWVFVLTDVALTMYIFLQMERDRFLSLLSGTTPGQVSFNRDFVMSVIIHVVLPIIALLGVQFPEALRQAFSWVGAIQGGH